MALVKATLNAQLTTVFDQLATNTDGPAGRQQLIDGLVNAIDAYIKTALVSVTVATTGTASAQTGTGTGSLS